MNEEQEERERNFLFFGMAFSDEQRDALLENPWFQFFMLIIFIVVVSLYCYSLMFPYQS